ncbi:hypothetical protein HYH03_019141 [Edaphochlamys debaryana]|uniref:Guanylate cyclase domain-containing protein n=1 Tax=Edaphochlamys debaryana TaxID=47281 RepID=A0A835XF91_9CHLO|nr:hypothetical protein HYH03_019141 [Edaphochlamys debaryana]|eukprot:KAG2481897.1 hypothetical protein HYH03_019141 [Edaphochlamys debaryana]
MRHRTVGDYIRNWVEVWPTPDNPGPNDWWMLGSEVFGEDLDHGAFLDLTRLLTADPGFALSDIPVQFRDAGSSAYAGRYTAMPLFLTTFNLLYRRDIFEQYSLSVPATWDNALDIADKYGRGALGPGQPDMGFCFESNPACGYAQAMIVYILASMVQLKGASDGAYFDPVTMDPLYTSPAMREALRIYGALRSHSVPDSTPCWAVYQMLASGRCLMLWTWSFNFKASRASHNSSSMSGRQGVAGIPGSAVVMDRSTGRMGPCTREACPSAKEAPDPRTGGSRLVNQVVPVDGISFGINRHAPAHRQAAAYAMLSAFTGAKEHFRMALLPYTEIAPMRYSALDEKAWLNAGYNARDLKDFLAQFRTSFDADNVYYELRMPGTFQTYTLVQYLLYRYNANNYTHEELMSWANEGTERIFASLGGRDRLRPLYQGSIGYKPPTVTAQPKSGGSSSGTLLTAVLVPSLVSLVLLGAGLWAYLRCARLRDERRARLSAAPGAGPGTTLLVTDIQDSTCLWESLPASVMDVALKTHHRVIRQLLIQHAGYESATEGDSFILAFAKPDRALAFALSAQDALLAAEWPGELLDSAHATTLVVTHDTTACAAAQLSIAGPALWKEVFGTAPAVDAVPVHATDSKVRITGRSSAESTDIALVSQLKALDCSAEDRPSTAEPAAPADIEADAGRRTPQSSRLLRSTAPGEANSMGAVGLNDALDVGGVPWAMSSRPGTSPAAGRTTNSDTHAFQVAATASVEAEAGSAGALLKVPLSGTAVRHMPLSESAPQPHQSTGSRKAALEPARSSRLLRGPRNEACIPAAHVSSRGSQLARVLGIPSKRGALAGVSLSEPRPRSVEGSLHEEAVAACGSIANTEGPHSGMPLSPFITGGQAAPGSPVVMAPAPATLGGFESEFSGAAAAGARSMRAGSASTTFVDEGLYCSGGTGGTMAAGRGLPCMVATTLKGVIHQAFPEVHPSQAAGLAHSTVLFRGLRVRMGMHCGLGEAEVSDNKASGRITYPGRALQMAKAVSDAGRGGHVTLSSAVLGALDPRPGHVHYSGPYLVLQGGKCVLKEGQAPVDVLCAFSSALLPRAGHMEGLRCFATKVPGTLQAPLGLMAVALAQVEDPDEFAGWGLEASLASHKALLGEAARLAVHHGGYLVHTPPGSFQAAFTSPAAALAWLLDLQEDLDPGTTEEVVAVPTLEVPRVATQAALSSDTDRDVAFLTRAAAMARLSILMVRGGLDVGVLPATMGPTGEVAYAGTALKRAACLAANAAWHEILVSLEAVRGVLGEGHPLSQAIALRTTQQRRRPASARFRTSVPSRDARQGYVDLLKAFAVAERSTSQTSQGGPGTAPFGQSPGVGASQYRGQSQSQYGASGNLPSRISAGGALPDELLAEGVAGTLLLRSLPGGVPGPVREAPQQSQDVVFGPGLRLVKHKGAVLEACAVRRQGAAAVATPNAMMTPELEGTPAGLTPHKEERTGSAATTPTRAVTTPWLAVLRPSLEERLQFNAETPDQRMGSGGHNR